MKRGVILNKILLEFDVISYRKKLIDMKNKAHQEYLRNKGTLEGMSFKSMENAFELAINEMESFATFENVKIE